MDWSGVDYLWIIVMFFGTTFSALLISFGTTWLHPKLVLKKKQKTFLLSLSPSLASSYLFEQWLRLGTSSVWLPLQDESLYVFPNCKSLWIKTSAKWLNVNVNVFISCLDSHSDGTRSLQRIHWWASDAMLHFSKSVMLKKQIHLYLGRPEGE